MGQRNYSDDNNNNTPYLYNVYYILSTILLPTRTKNIKNKKIKTTHDVHYNFPFKKHIRGFIATWLGACTRRFYFYTYYIIYCNNPFGRAFLCFGSTGTQYNILVQQ